MIKTKEFCDIHKIPYITIGLKINKSGKKIEGNPCKYFNKTTINQKYKYYFHDCETWTEWDYNRCMKFNNEFYDKKTCNALNINLTNSKFMIIDIDAWDEEKDIANEILVKQYLEDYGESNQSTSTRKKLPHLWRLKNENDKNTTKTGFKKGLDLIYTNVFEWIDSTIENYTEVKDIPDFDKSKSIVTPDSFSEKAKCYDHFIREDKKGRHLIV